MAYGKRGLGVREVAFRCRHRSRDRGPVTHRTSPWREEKGAVVIHVRLTPRGGRDVIEGVEVLADGRAVLKARVRAAPEKGLANAALAKLVADTFDVPKSAVSVVAGGSSRLKTVRVAADPATLRKQLQELV